MAGLATTGVIAAALAVVWILVAAGLSFVAARRFRLAERVLGAARANALSPEQRSKIAKHAASRRWGKG